ncbi:Paraquat-inducible protein A [hydrothermal vent metagenome]|uniref:Paraquat-inducible protein A n=1 Tax=hydrothermal vent metagenome TaxID=652676 RepID=A0A3B0Y0P4_9ZZZZ
MAKFIRAKDRGLAACHTCGKVVKLANTHKLHVHKLHAHKQQVCPRCRCDIHYRKNDSVNRAWAFLISAFIMYIPANTEPIMHTQAFGQESSDTIISGVLYFLAHGDWPLALVIFSASVLLPLIKMISIAYILIMVQRGANVKKKENTKLYFLAEVMGRWSMVDVFVVALLVALVQMGALTSIQPGPAGIAFASMVILTMFSAMAFDPKLIWDQSENLER